MCGYRYIHVYWLHGSTDCRENVWKETFINYFTEPDVALCTPGRMLGSVLFTLMLLWQNTRIKATYEWSYLSGVSWFYKVRVHDSYDRCNDSRQTSRHGTEEVAEDSHPMHKQEAGEGGQYWNGAGFRTFKVHSQWHTSSKATSPKPFHSVP